MVLISLFTKSMLLLHKGLSLRILWIETEKRRMWIENNVIIGLGILKRRTILELVLLVLVDIVILEVNGCECDHWMIIVLGILKKEEQF